jgi:molybdopterin-guanine dinucleotide biosynthesis protein A
VARRGDILQDAISGSRPPRESAGPLYTQPGPPSTVRDSQVSKPDPLGGIRTPLSEVRTTYSKVLGQGIPWPMSRTVKSLVLTHIQASTCALPLPAQAEARCYHVAYRL